MSERVFRIYGANLKQPFRYAFNLAQELLKGGANLEIVVRNRKEKRTDPQNKRLWVLNGAVAEAVWVEGRQYGSLVWHEFFKGEFIGFEETEMPDGTIKREPISTTKLSIEEMAKYQTKIECWCAERGYPVMVD